ncbi:CHASE2 domain-containing protein [Tumidithrix elongata RA019]|uniref:CHASE2 domain-containing protein n=1 Tax=Tumidithrix elongata BACA0141 TaxID=2716417 RepID=A0AAW9Q6U2_9CYAN|nr:CHASE2 domain-containing protein [Tumidithrix elongata RA019]
MVVYRLEIERIGHQCRFQLMTEGKHFPPVLLLHSETVATAYGNWQEAYLNYYRAMPDAESLPELPMRGKLASGGDISASPQDWHTKLGEAEAKLLREFTYWLRSPELYALRAEINTAVLANSKSFTSIDLFICCHSEELIRLPWEAWDLGDEFAAPNAIQIARYVTTHSETSSHRLRKGKVRLLAIWGDDSSLNFQTDRRAMQMLAETVEIHTVAWQKGETAETFYEKIRQAMVDERGWDILFFTGHSQETELTGGVIEIAPNAAFLIRDLEPHLLVAKQRGLQVALFNSCSGLSIAEWLVDRVGLPQVAIMREPIHNRIAQEFLIQFVQGLSSRQNVCQAIATACSYLHHKRSTYPSAYLIPSLFRHPDAPLFVLPKSVWLEQLKLLVPSPWQAIALISLCALSWQPSVQTQLLDKRIFLQALYRQHTGRIPDRKPPVVLVQIDEESIRRAGISTPNPMNREYLASIVNRLSELNVRIAGLDYLLDRPHTSEDKGASDRLLAKAFQTAIDQKQMRFVLATVYDEGKWSSPLPEFTIQPGVTDAHIHQSVYFLALPQSDLEKQPFAYTLAKLRDPNLKSPSVSRIAEFSADVGQNWFTPILDFSIPADRAYTTIPAWQLLDPTMKLPENLRIADRIAIVSANYSEAGIFQQGSDRFPMPTAIAYGQRFSAPRNDSSSGFASETMTGGELHAYGVWHFLAKRWVVPIPDLLGIAIALLIGGAVILIVPFKRKGGRLAIVAGTSIYIVVCLELYISAALLIPIAFPTIAFLLYVIPLRLR